MSDQDEAGNNQVKRRPPHLSATSLGTNASGIADSTISYAGTDVSISAFPSPPIDIPTPTSYTYGDRFPPSIPDYQTPMRFEFGTPPTPRSPANSLHGSSKSQETRSMKSGTTLRSAHSDHTEKAIPPLPTLEIPKAAAIAEYSPSPSSSSQPSTIYQPTRPLAVRKEASPYPPVSISGRHFEKRPETPQSVVAASSLLDWSDAASGISINPSEERLLTTSFITSLLSQSPEPFPGRKLSNTRSNLVRQLDGEKGEFPPQVSRYEVTGSMVSSSHNSIPPFYPSDLLSAADREGPQPRGISTLDHSQRSFYSVSRRTSNDYSETLHSGEEQVHAAVRSASLSYALNGSDAHPVGVVPAYHISYGGSNRSDGRQISVVESNTSMITSSSIVSKPPEHQADAPRNVRHFNGFDDRAPRESEEDFVKLGGADLYLERPDTRGSPALPSTASPLNRFGDLSHRSRSSTNQASSSKFGLQRNPSMKSVVSSLVSRISHNSTVQRTRYMAWLRKRPLPPIPVASHRPPEFPNAEEIQKDEESIPLPTLVKRAEDLSGMLIRGRYPSGVENGNEFHYKEAYDPGISLQTDDRDTYMQFDRRRGDDARSVSLFSRFRRPREVPGSPPAHSPSTSKIMSFEQRRNRRRIWTVIICVVIGVILAIAIPVALSHEKKSSAPVCSGNQTGAACTLDATCVCTSSSGSCKPLARSLSLMVSDLNDLFLSNFTADQLSDAVVNTVGEPTNGLCANQAVLVDVEPGLDSASSPNRTKWAQTAILWNLGMSEDINATSTLQKFVSTAPWSGLSSIDGPTADDNQMFSINVSGFTFDFAMQTIIPLSALFVNSSPSRQQLSEISMTAGTVLDRMYSFSIASSTQRQRALMNYWTTVLQRQSSDLKLFIDAVQNSPFLIPFDANSSPGGDDLINLMSNTSSTQFPVPLSCYPGLTSTQLERIDALEVNVFGLEAAVTTSNFSSSCFPDRPTYGVIDLLGLRLPFPDDRKGVALQAATLSKDATIRAVVYSGEALSALPGATTLPDVTTSNMDPREFGTADFLNHVLLNYLSSISNVTLAVDLISHVLSSGVLANNSDIALSLSSLPVLEFAVLGTITPQDIDSSVSSFSTAEGSLFFGSNAGQAFRSWALTNSSASIAWVESALSSEAVHEGSSTDQNFESVWTPASELIASGSTDASDVQKVTSSLSSLGLFS